MVCAEYLFLHPLQRQIPYCKNLVRQLSWQSKGLKILVSGVQFPPTPHNRKRKRKRKRNTNRKNGKPILFPFLFLFLILTEVRTLRRCWCSSPTSHILLRPIFNTCSSFVMFQKIKIIISYFIKRCTRMIIGFR